MVQENGSHSKLNLVFDTWKDNTPLPNCNEFPTTVLPRFNNIDVNYFKLNEVNTEEKFYYIIDHMNNLTDYLSNPELFLKPEVEELCRTKNLKIILTNRYEVNNSEFLVIQKLINFIKSKNLKEENFYLFNNNSYLQKYKKELNTKINVHTNRFLAEYISNTMLRYNIQYTENKEFLFLCQNRVSKIHRIILLSYLYRNNILNDVNWSLISPNDNYNLKYDSTFSEYIKENITDIEIFSHVKNKLSNYETIMNIERYEEIIETKNFSESYINITTETLFSDNELHISEKSFKPFYFLQLPIFISEYNHLKYMRLIYNFDFFDDLIDHSYDLEKDPVKRMNMVLNEIKRLHNNKEKVIEFYKNNKHRLYKNQEIIKDIITNSDMDNYFLALSNNTYYDDILLHDYDEVINERLGKKIKKLI